MARLSQNVIGALGIGVVALIYLVEAFKLPFGKASMPGIGFVPVLFGVILLALCVMLIGRELLLPAKNITRQADLWEEEEDNGRSTGFKKPVIISIALLVYPVVLVYLGFILSTTALLFVALRVMEYRSWPASLLVAAAATILAYFVFSNWLSVYFPNGILG